jgi:FkbM family methyltransferase
MAFFLLEQYGYNKKIYIGAEEGDIVIDGGGGIGDTALFFANKVGNSGKVISFEFINKNLDIFKKNLEFNPNLSSIIEIVDKPLWSSSSQLIYIEKSDTNTRVTKNPTRNETKSFKTLSIDDYVKNNKILKIDLIKMDIENAEIEALKGAMKTIIKHKPKLAISIYHSFNNYYEIPEFIKSLEPKYKLYIDHFTTLQEEVILFGKVE